MSFHWLKQYMPRSLFARAALIMVLPIVVIQLVVSVVFIGRHLEDVTTQMTLTMVRELAMVRAQVDGAQSQAEALARAAPLLEPLQIELRFVAPGALPEDDVSRWYDFTAPTVARVFRLTLPGVRSVVFPDSRDMQLYLDTEFGTAEFSFNRRRVSAAAPHQLIVTMLGFGLLMTVIAFLYMRNQLRPIRRLAQAAEAFGRGRSVPYTPRGATEVRIAGSAFLDMRARIERYIEQRTLMLSGVSHDLRTPLTRMKLELALLDEADAAPLRRDVDEMQALLDAFLDFARGEAGGEVESCDPVALAQAVIADAQRAGAPVRLVATEGAGAVDLRPLAIRRALENLIANAVRYGSRAELSVTLTDRALRFRVEDDGPGIPPDLRAEAIKPFARLDPARNQDCGSGVGLGLAIVNDIARAHGGTLRLGVSEGLGGLCADIVIAR